MKVNFRVLFSSLALALSMPALAAQEAATPAADVPAVIQPETQAGEQPGWIAQKWDAVKHSYESAKEAVAEKFSSDDEEVESEKVETEVTAEKAPPEPATLDQAVKN